MLKAMEAWSAHPIIDVSLAATVAAACTVDASQRFISCVLLPQNFVPGCRATGALTFSSKSKVSPSYRNSLRSMKRFVVPSLIEHALNSTSS